MNIAISTNSLWNFLKFRKNLVFSLIKQGHKVFIFTDKIDKKSKNFKNLKFILIPIKRKPYYFFSDILVIYNYFKFFYVYKIDFFLGFSHKINIYGGLVCKILNLKNILNITGLGTAFIEKKIFKNIILILYKLIKSTKSYYLFHNHHDKKIFIESSIVENKNSAIIPGSGINTNIKIPHIKLKKKKITFTFIGRLIYQKGIYEFLKAAELILNLNYHQNKINFKIIGEADDQNISNINKNLLNNFKRKKHFFFMGFLDEKKLFKEIQKSDCIVLPSYREGLPRVLLESFLHSKPAIATNVPGCNSLVKNNFNGLLCKVKNINSLYECFNKFIRMSIKQRKILGRNGRFLVLKKFSEQIVIKKYIHLIK